MIRKFYTHIYTYMYNHTCVKKKMFKLKLYNCEIHGSIFILKKKVNKIFEFIKFSSEKTR